MNTKNLFFGLFACASLMIASCTASDDSNLYEDGVRKDHITKGTDAVRKDHITKGTDAVRKDHITKGTDAVRKDHITKGTDAAH
jgi:hypothetical protein